MKKQLLHLLIAATLALSAAAASAVPTALAPTLEQSQAAHLSAEVVSRFHYRAQPLDAAMSDKIFTRYLKSLDPEKFFFTQADIDVMSKQRSTLGKAILGENLSAPFAIFNLYAQRVSERFTFARSMTKEKFDFSSRESFMVDREKEAWPASVDELHTLWRKQVKNDWLRLKLAGVAAPQIAQTLNKRYDSALQEVTRVTPEEAFETFMNAYTMAIDPHTNYMGPRATQEFDIAMSLSLEGIGATMSQKGGYNTIREMVPGGPAIRSGKLRVGDRIVGVGQGADGPVVDVEGWRLNETIGLIRGPADSTVLLDVLPAGALPDAGRRRVAIVRKKIDLAEAAAKKTMINVPDGSATKQIGVITLPTFYRDFEAEQSGEKDFRSVTRDVAVLLAELKAAKADGVVIDLRNNGGGSLTEAIGLTGLFTGKGPVLQQRDARGKIIVDSHAGAAAVWDGPVGVLINRGSASASEIFAAAIQDYGRGTVIGERSFGKGTVQSTINLDQLVKQSKPEFGELKMTTAQFFRINGGTTQLRGVKPDITFPTDLDADDRGESGFDNALPWTQIKPATYAASGALKPVIPVLMKRSEARIKANQEFTNIEGDMTRFMQKKKANVISLNEADRRKERDDQLTRLTARLTSARPGMTRAESARAMLDDGLDSNERDLGVELAAGLAQKEAKDVFLQEAARIVSDQAGLLKTNTEAAIAAKAAGKQLQTKPVAEAMTPG
ncbi:MAG: tail-specific protease [Oxalobacteraceae bacterium]|nr:tail-specific protease [Oxalobacteraceae bacterium]